MVQEPRGGAGPLRDAGLATPPIQPVTDIGRCAIGIDDRGQVPGAVIAVGGGVSAGPGSGR